MCTKENFEGDYRSIQNYYPRFLSELIRRGVIDYAGNFDPKLSFLNYLCGVILYHIMWIDQCFGGKKLLQKIESFGN